MDNNFKILDSINNDVIVSDYLECERIYKTNNRSLFKSIAVASLVVSLTPNAQAVEVEHEICYEYDYSRTDAIQAQSDYLDYYIQKVTEMATPLVIKDDLIDEILSFKTLKENWDGYGAIPLETKSAMNAIKILNKLDNSSISKVNELYPNTHGTVTIEFENINSEKLHLEVGNDTFGYFVELNELGVVFFNELGFCNENIKELIENIQSI